MEFYFDALLFHDDAGEDHVVTSMSPSYRVV